MGERISDEEQEFLFSQINALEPEQAATLLRATLAELNSQTDTTGRAE